MTNLKKIICAAVLAILPCSVFADYFVRPEIDYVSPQDKDRSSSSATVGYGLSAGTQLGSAQEHEISLDLLYWNENESRFQTVPSISSFAWKHKMMPVLLGYRYYAGGSNSKVRLFLGALAGYTHANESFSANQSSPAINGSASASRWLPTLGGTAGLEIKASDRVSVQLGYRYLHIFEKNYQSTAFAVHPDAYNANLFTGAVSLKF